METLFLTCAVIGGSVFAIQFVLALIGFGSEDLDLADDVPDDLPDHAGHDSLGHGSAADHGSTWLFGVISLRTVVAAVTFFGLIGYAAFQAGQGPSVSLTVGILAGLAAMYGIHYLMLQLSRLGQDRTLRIDSAVGHVGTVYLPIPAAGQGVGKVTLAVHEQLVEYAATTSEATPLPRGAKVVVTRVVGAGTVEVAPVGEPVSAGDV